MLTKHEVFQRNSNEGLVWVARTRDAETGIPYLFWAAWKERPPESTLTNLDNTADRENPMNLAANYVRDRGRELRVIRRTTAKKYWKIEEA